MIRARAAADYEALRERLFGIERPGVRATGLSVLVRCGLAAWACGRHDLVAPLPRTSLASVPSSDHASACSTLAKLIANMILNPRQEMPPCRM